MFTFHCDPQVCQTEDFFDCYPAVLSAYKHAKVFSNGGVDEEEENEKKKKEDKEAGIKNKSEDEDEKVSGKVEPSLEYAEFQKFLQSLRQYFIFCQVIWLHLM